MANTGDADDDEYLAEMTKGANFAASSRCVRNKCQSTSSSSSFHSSGESSSHGSAADGGLRRGSLPPLVRVPKRARDARPDAPAADRPHLRPQRLPRRVELSAPVATFPSISFASSGSGSGPASTACVALNLPRIPPPSLPTADSYLERFQK